MENPLDGILPNFTIFGAEFTQLWQKIVAGVWGLAIVAAIVFLIIGLVNMGQNSSSDPNAVAEGKKTALRAGVSLGILVALGVVVGAIVAIFS